MDNQQDIYQHFKIGLEFEFFSTMNDVEIIKNLSKVLKKKIVIPTELVGLNKRVVKPKTPFNVTSKVFALKPDYSGGEQMNELITGPLPFYEARIQIIRMLKWIEKNGWTTQKTSMHINISYDKEALKTRTEIMTLDRLKVCLSFDESYIYKKFPKRKNNVYAKSIKEIYPTNKFIFNSNFQITSSSNYLVPDTKYYGINFLKQQKNYLEIRYVGGRNYEKKINSVLSVVSHCVKELWDIVQHPELNTKDMAQLNTIISKHKKMVTSFSDFNQFILRYPKIKLMVDLDGRVEIIKTFYNTMLRDKIYNLIVKCGMKSGEINYDRDIGMVQVRNATLKRCDSVKKFEFINCHIDGILNYCDFYNCTILDSHLNHCRLFKKNQVIRSKITKTPIHIDNILEECYIDNKNTLVSGKLIKCIIRNGNVSDLTVMEKTTKVKTN